MSEWKAARPRRPIPDGPQARDEAATAYDEQMGWGSEAKPVITPPPARRLDGSARPIMLGHKWWGAIVHDSPKVGDQILIRSSYWGGWYTKVHKILAVYEADPSVAIVEVWPADRPTSPDVPPNPHITDNPLSAGQFALLRAIAADPGSGGWHKGTVKALLRRGLLQTEGDHYGLTPEGSDLLVLLGGKP